MLCRQRRVGSVMIKAAKLKQLNWKLNVDVFVGVSLPTVYHSSLQLAFLFLLSTVWSKTVRQPSQTTQLEGLYNILSPSVGKSRRWHRWRSCLHPESPRYLWCAWWPCRPLTAAGYRRTFAGDVPRCTVVQKRIFFFILEKTCCNLQLQRADPGTAEWEECPWVNLHTAQMGF